MRKKFRKRENFLELIGCGFESCCIHMGKLVYAL